MQIRNLQGEEVMKNKLMWLFSFLLITAFVLSACGPAATEAPATEAPVVATEAPATEPPATEAPVVEPAGTLRIWADDTRAPILQDLAAEFLAAYNIELVVELKSSLRDDFQVAAPLGEGPDIVVLTAHDQAGPLVSNGLLAEIDLGDKAGDFVQPALDACTFDGKLYCLPYATENLGFFYNTDLVSTPPTTWDEVLSMGRALKEEGKVEYVMAVVGDATYDMYPIYSSLGGYIFGKDENGNWNPQDVGIDSPGMIAGVQWIADGVAAGDFPSDWDWGNNHALFETGKTPFIMAGPWALSRIRESGVPYAVTSFPNDGFPLAGTQGFFVNSQSENVLLAQAFLTEFVATEETMLKLFEAGQRPPAYIPALEQVNDPDLAAMAVAGENSVMMPAIPEMGTVWGAWKDAVSLSARDGKQDVPTAMKEGADKIRTLIANPLTGMINVPGSYQAAAGCTGDWQPECSVTALTMGDDGKYYSGPFTLPAGDYEYKVALDGSWTTNYGSDGAQDGPNYTLSLAAETAVSFIYDPATKLVEVKTE